MMNTKTLSSSAFVSASLLAATLAVSNAEAQGADEIVVKIGAAAPLTGPQSHLGKDNENGTRMAIDDLNAQGVEIGGKKAKLELISADDQCDPKTEP